MGREKLWGELEDSVGGDEQVSWSGVRNTLVKSERQKAREQRGKGAAGRDMSRDVYLGKTFLGSVFSQIFKGTESGCFAGML